MKGFLDLDGVLFDFMGSACKVLDINLNDPKIRQIFKSDRHGHTLDNYVGTDRMWKEIDKHGVDFWANLELFPWSMELWNKLNGFFGDKNTYICTAPSNNHLCAAGKVLAINRHFKTKQFVITPRKAACASSVSFLVDDTDKQIKRFVKGGGKAFHWPNPLYLLDTPGAVADTMKLLDAILEAWKADLEWVKAVG